MTELFKIKKFNGGKNIERSYIKLISSTEGKMLNGVIENLNNLTDEK